MKSTRSLKTKLTAFAFSAVALTSCTGGGPGDEQDLSEALSRDDVFTVAEADCIAEKVFSEYGDNESALESISNADNISELESGENAVDGFTENFAEFQQDCQGATAEESN